MDLDLAGEHVVDVQLGYTVMITFSGPHGVSIEGAFTFTDPNGTLSLDPESDSEEALNPVSYLAGAEAAWAKADETTGALDVAFTDGRHLRVEADPQYEAWSYAGPKRHKVFSMPGGELNGVAPDPD